MSKETYVLKVSSQGQLTLPRDLREQLHLQPGSRVAVTTTSGGGLKLSSQTPIEKHFGAMPHAWTQDGQDAAEYARELRDSLQPAVKRSV